MRLRKLIALTAIGAVAAAGCAGDDSDDGDPAATAGTEPAAEADHPYGDHHSDEYADDEVWLCRPGHDEICTEDMDIQVIEADGSVEMIEFEPVDDSPVDCFYVYPTVSEDPGANSDLVPGDSEIATVRTQVAHLGSECRVFAPMYRQVTLTSLLGGLGDNGGDGNGEGPFTGESREIAYESLLDAWKHYMANDNDGRGVILVGHSQGAGVLARLLAEEIEPDEDLSERLVAAYLLGTSVQEPTGDDGEGDLVDLQPCREADETGCVISWSTYRATDPPPENGIFGRGGDGTRAICTNPGDLSGAMAPLDPYFGTSEAGVAGLPASDPDTVWVDPDTGVEITAPWVSLPGLLEGECVEEGPYHYLEVTIETEGPRTDEIGGDLTPEWGLHLVDANVAMGNMIELVRSQIESYTGS